MDTFQIYAIPAQSVISQKTKDFFEKREYFTFF